MEKTHNRKRYILKNLLEQEIISGKYAFNQLFPGIRQVSEEHRISYMTASHIIKMLTDEGYLRSQNGVGHFVNYIPTDTAIVQKKVNIITTSKFYFMMKAIFTDAVELFRSKGWTVNLIRCPERDISSVVSNINSPDAYSIVCGLNIPWQKFQASIGSLAKRVLVLGVLAGHSDITSIVSNEYETIQQTMFHFARSGRRNIAILAKNPDNELEALRLGAWRSTLLASGHSYEWTIKHCFFFSNDTGKYKIQNALPQLERWLKSIAGDTDGLILPIEHTETIHACLKCGLRIPEDISLMLIAFFHLESIKKNIPYGLDMDVQDHNYAGHFQCALDILEERFRSGKKTEGFWHFCPPGKIQKCSWL